MHRPGTIDVSLAGTILAVVAVILTLLVASSAPVAATHGAFASMHTTASELSNGSTTNAEVERSGEAGFVSHDTHLSQTRTHYPIDSISQTLYDDVSEFDGSLSGSYQWQTDGLDMRGGELELPASSVNFGSDTTWTVAMQFTPESGKVMRFGAGDDGSTGAIAFFWNRQGNEEVEAIVRGGSDNTGVFGLDSGSSGPIPPTDYAQAGEKHTVSLTRRGDTMTLRLNGRFVTQTTVAVGSVDITGPFENSYYGGSQEMRYHDIRTFDDALAPGQLYRLTESPNSKLSPVTSERLALDAGVGSTAYGTVGPSNTFDGTFQNSPEWVSGASGTALRFDGYHDDDSLSVPDSYRTDLSFGYSISMWVKADREVSPPDEFRVGLVTKKSNALQPGWAIGANDGTLFLEHDDWDATVDTPELFDSTWSHLAVVHSSGEIDVYVDGELIKTVNVPKSPSQNSEPMTLGSYGDYRHANVTLDDVRLMDSTILTSEQVQFLADNPAAQLPESSTYSNEHSMSNTIEGFADLELQNAKADVTWKAADGTVLTQATFTTTGNHSATWTRPTTDTVTTEVEFTATGPNALARLYGEGVMSKTVEPTLDLWMPEDGGKLNGTSEHLAVNVTDPDLGTAKSDSVTVDIRIDGEVVSTQTVNAEGTVQYSPGEIPGGHHTWSAAATDEYGHTVETEQRGFRSPMILYLHHENGTQLLTKEVTVEMVGTASMSNFVTERATSDGTITFGQLPDEQLALRISAANYTTRTMLVDNPYGTVERHTNLIDSSSAAGYSQCFALDSRGAGFAPDNSWLIVQQHINGSWRDMAGGYFGAANSVCFDLVDEEDYRLAIRDEGDRRNLGGYRGDSSFAQQTRNLIVEGQTFGLERGTTYEWEVESVVTNETIGSRELLFKFNARDRRIEDLHIVIHERGDPSNVLDELYAYGTVGSYNANIPIPADESETEWTISWEAELYPTGDADEPAQHIDGTWRVGADGTATPLGLSEFWTKVALGGVILLVAGVFGFIHAPTGAVITAGLTGIFAVMGYLEIPQTVLMFAISLSVVGFAASRRA
ncbi:LamG-like jellyroll fold domain-containing protein [Halomarina oriensis]|uniref:LamG domain-containing protein n=1 Tax=Halomarina oriensis TaxID=671145 RepID=A0A6B0GF59_9EURY|nr:LamG-like jellyroll fold domain-containing protein [Halomarina oriensis]MWG33140.1 hypothetical protein [Halomarina oriensis]